MNYKFYTEPALDSLGPFGNAIGSMLATIAAQNLLMILENTKVALAKKRACNWIRRPGMRPISRTLVRP